MTGGLQVCNVGATGRNRANVNDTGKICHVRALAMQAMPGGGECVTRVRAGRSDAPEPVIRYMFM
jgi:hypothetical protein